MFFKVKKEKGAAAVEFAFLLPILVMIAFGIIYFAPVFNNYIAVNHAARDGARLLAVKAKFDANGNLNSNGVYEDNRLKMYIENNLPDHVKNELINLEININSPNPAFIGSDASVTVSGDIILNIPLVMENRTINISREVIMRLEQ